MRKVCVGFVLCLLTVVHCMREPVFTRTHDGHLIVDVSGVPLASAVTVTVAGARSDAAEQKTVTAALHLTAGAHWKTTISDVTSDDAVLHYVITYQFRTGQRSYTGSQFLSRVETSLEVLGTPHFLRRRAHTVFYDDFSSGKIDGNKWKHDCSADGVGNDEFQMYTPESRNSYVKNGVLYIRPTLTTDRFGDDFISHGTFDARKQYGYCTNGDCVRHGWGQVHPVMSALLRSSGQIHYGRVEVVAQLPKGDWIWPAIWLMPRDHVYGGWPRSGEIDIMETCGNLHLNHPNGESRGVDVDQSHIHYGSDPSAAKSEGAVYKLQGSTFGDGFHTYWLDWTESHIKIGVDGHTVFTSNTPSNGYWGHGGFHGNNLWQHGGHNAPFDKPFYLILNVAIGGNFFWDGLKNHPYDKPWHYNDASKMMYFWNARNSWLPTWHGEDVAMKIKSVKMDQY
ncbi:beta-1,3-glucan-binding protein-like [Littorina saxatilis]|uniref:GH16 domain-containing protein n=1 Tax=Littorina saxatilis TaxID=31220 RepID=A0AAN9AYV5_9CAEN